MNRYAQAVAAGIPALARSVVAGAIMALLQGLATTPALADGTAITAGTTRGPVTNLPLPRFVSMKADKANARRGPGLSHRIDWVFTRKHMPLQVTAEYGNWRRVRDIDGAGGWIHYSLLSGVRTVLVTKNNTPLRITPAPGADPNAYAERGVVAFLGKCLPQWCRITADGESGWVLKSEIWGVGKDELRD